MITALIIIGAVLLLALSLLSYTAGFRQGRDTGWMDHYFETVAKERARRDVRGRFKSQKATDGTHRLCSHLAHKNNKLVA